MKADRGFLDANILFSVAYGSRGLERLWNLEKKGVCVLFASMHVIEEVKRNLTDPEQVRRLETHLSNVRVVIEADPSVKYPVDLPKEDRQVLMAAISANADYLLTGDMKHFGKYFGQTIAGVTISMVRDYLVSKMMP